MLVLGFFTWIGESYLGHVGAERLLAQDVKVLVNGSKGLAGMNVGAGRHPDSLEAGVLKHFVVVIVGSNAKGLILLVVLGPFDFVRQDAAYGDHTSIRRTVEQSVNMTLSL